MGLRLENNICENGPEEIEIDSKRNLRKRTKKNLTL
jgi:hypothetical protein